jgi:hypothetical protein
VVLTFVPQEHRIADASSPRLGFGIGDNAEARRCARAPLPAGSRWPCRCARSECSDPSESSSRYAQATAPPLPFQIGPVEFVAAGHQVAVRCPAELAHIVQRAAGVWEPRRAPVAGVERRQVAPLIRAFEAAPRIRCSARLACRLPEQWWLRLAAVAAQRHS